MTSVVSPDLTERMALAGPHPALRPLEIFPRMNADRILAILDDPAHAVEDRNRLRWYQRVIIVRTIGWVAGAVAGLALNVALFGALILWTIGNGVAVSGFVSPVTLVFVWSSLAWLGLYWGVGDIAPSTRVAIQVRILTRQSAPGRSGRVSRLEVIQTLATVGKFGRSFFRATSGRTFNVGIRPDLAEDLAQMSQAVMLHVPEGGPDALRDSASNLASYSEFARDVTGLLVVQRLDLVRELAEHQPAGVLMSGPMSNELRSYLQPLGRRTMIEAFTDFALPSLAALVSIIALIVSLTAAK